MSMNNTTKQGQGLKLRYFIENNFKALNLNRKILKFFTLNNNLNPISINKTKTNKI